MIRLIINVLFKLVIALVNVILLPIDALINQFIPGLSNFFSYVENLFSTIGNTLPFVISYTGFNDVVLDIIVLYFSFILTVPLMVHTIKLAIAWYDKLKA